MPDTVTIYRCDSYGCIESKAGCSLSKSGKSWSRVNSCGGLRWFNSANGWTESKRAALASAVEYHSKNVQRERRSLETAKTKLANAFRDYKRFDEQEADNA